MYGTITFRSAGWKIDTKSTLQEAASGIINVMGNFSTEDRFRVADNPSGKGRYFGPAQIAINAAKWDRNEGPSVAPLGKATDLSCKN